MDEDDDGGGIGSLFLDENYVEQRISIGHHEIPVLSLQCSSTDYDLTGQIIWPGTELLLNYIVDHSQSFQGASIIELGSGVGVTGLLCGRIGCRKVVMTDHNDIVLKIMRKNVALQQDTALLSRIACEKLEWGNEEQLSLILDKHPEGFDYILGADICYQQCNIPPLIRTVNKLLQHHHCRKFLLAYVSRIQSTDRAFFNEASEHNLELREVEVSRTSPGDGIYSGVIYEIILKRDCHNCRTFTAPNI
ncbi:protein-lysine methyltransferase C42C1.13-like isoform X1 [Selaginella moellendorffii]|uniref:protein-lysine methyltransferase C42C1.13-like isoform X1 n=1 Tax=Selaginella moellendorffii TaxID=88036 RepID=UPI000D1D0D7B|nr:protein-lysine methyltransferase C42C1.13-like isoform X1 [Selaginella moellendorffii]|eukprot:XP_024531491.1 protein-lysine methyltransferase C42C1.13-like isoform X1 [Selaginella moellendorffii]